MPLLVVKLDSSDTESTCELGIKKVIKLQSYSKEKGYTSYLNIPVSFRFVFGI